MTREARSQMFQQVDVYPVTCEELSEGRSNLEVLEAVIRGGAKISRLDLPSESSSQVTG